MPSEPTPIPVTLLENRDFHEVVEYLDGIPLALWALAEQAANWEMAERSAAVGWAAGTARADAAASRTRTAFYDAVNKVDLGDLANALRALRGIRFRVRLLATLRAPAPATTSQGADARFLTAEADYIRVHQPGRELVAQELAAIAARLAARDADETAEATRLGRVLTYRRNPDAPGLELTVWLPNTTLATCPFSVSQHPTNKVAVRLATPAEADRVAAEVQDIAETV
jgi:hypothetical protein